MAVSPKDATRWHLLVDMLAPQRKTSIVDIGANPINPAPYDGLLAENLACVYGFEPQEVAFQKLQEKPHANRIVLPHAIGDGQSATLHVCKHSGFSSLLEPDPAAIDYLGHWHGHMKVIDKVTVDTVKLDDIVEIQHVDLIKIDIQGGEQAVFQNAENTLQKAVAVFTEVAAIPLYKNQPLIHDQLLTLATHGYGLHKFDFFKAKSLGSRFATFLQQRYHENQLIDGDAILIKAIPVLDKLSDEELKHLAILADAIMHSYDLVLAILDLLHMRDVIATKQAIMSYCDLVPMPRPRRLRLARRNMEPLPR